MTLRQAAINRSNQLQRDASSARPKIRRSKSAPVRGLNSRDNVEDIQSDEASVLINWMPDVGGVETRPGCTSQVQASVSGDTTLDYDLRRLYTWNGGSTTKLLASYLEVSANSFELMNPSDNWSTEGSGGLENFNNPYWSSANINTYLCMVNGTDMVKWDGTSAAGITTLSVTVTGSVWSGAAYGVHNFKGRAYYWKEDVLGFWYAAAGAHEGILLHFPLQSIARLGGAVISINSWTRDAGNGADDFLVITTTKGEVLVYQGSDPSDATDWALIGMYRISEPVARDAFLELGGKVHVVTRSDFETLPDKFFRGPDSSRDTKISGRIRTHVANNAGEILDWQLAFDNVNNWIIINAPTGERTTTQFVKAQHGWCEWRDLNAGGWVADGGKVYFASYKQFDGYGNNLWYLDGEVDWTGETTAAIAFDSVTGYSLLGTTGEKRITMYRPMLHMSSGDVDVSTQLTFDVVNLFGPTNSLSMSGGSNVSPWGLPTGGSTPWGSPWGQNTNQSSSWLVGYGTGMQIALRVFGTANKLTRWSQTDWEYVRGGGY